MKYNYNIAQKRKYLMFRMSGVKCGVNLRSLRLLNNSGEPNISESCSRRVSDENTSI